MGRWIRKKRALCKKSFGLTKSGYAQKSVEETKAFTMYQTGDGRYLKLVDPTDEEIGLSKGQYKKSFKCCWFK